MWERKREGGGERERERERGGRERERERESERERDVPSLSVGPDLAPTFKHPFMLAPRLSAIETTCFICWSLCEQPERSCDAARHTHTHTLMAWLMAFPYGFRLVQTHESKCNEKPSAPPCEKSSVLLAVLVHYPAEARVGVPQVGSRRRRASTVGRSALEKEEGA